MTFEAALRTELMTITSLNNKVFPMRAPEGTEAPYLIYTTTLGDYDKSLEGWHKSKGSRPALWIMRPIPSWMERCLTLKPLRC